LFGLLLLLLVLAAGAAAAVGALGGRTPVRSLSRRIYEHQLP
jgi:hypothetical protein